ncbi:tol-pal system-associated acyl-CoA thioesterase [Marivita hallyeonensis]|uniref:Acyl-CoA thioester hydrolase n=1 Tax=Marivita hallyeonensis TaxID=996342 RepID=A0A1M5NCP1_9RHOB|nr:tol-pal system-associated acyl-CoA thioesterase [Marivita hallyeonensis]SHG87290.1 acyl-CoA thioester hydrolase [Marivita hallyeonensis]
MVHEFPVRVYYEDTDMGGIVYYANYLRFIERARSDWVRSLGIDQNAMREQDGVVFVVRRVEADYLQPAKFDDALLVRTAVKAVTGVRLIMTQEVLRDETVLFQAEVTIVCIGEGGAPARLPANIRRQMH